MVWMQPLAQELPYVTGVAVKKKKKKKKNSLFRFKKNSAGEKISREFYLLVVKHA